MLAVCRTRDKKPRGAQKEQGAAPSDDGAKRRKRDANLASFKEEEIWGTHRLSSGSSVGPGTWSTGKERDQGPEADMRKWPQVGGPITVKGDGLVQRPFKYPRGKKDGTRLPTRTSPKPRPERLQI